jgi:NADH-quinone oxidoreductase subunit D
LLGWTLPPRGQAIRLMCCEIARISSHLLGVGVYAMDVGAMTVFLYTFQQREIIYNLTEQLTGARFTTSYTRVGGQIRDLTPTFLSDLTKFLDGLEPVIDETNGLLTRNAIFMARTEGIGVISKEDAISYGLTGPNLRASGVEFDMRKNHPYLGYEQYEFDIPIGTKGDCYDRYLVRMEETKQSIRILRQLIKNFPSGDINVANQKGFLPKKEKVLMSMEELIHHFIIATQGIDVPPGEVYFGAENPKGELGFYIHSKGGGVPYRLKIRAPSFVNLSILPKVLKGHTMSDLVAILGSLDFVMGECDR